MTSIARAATLAVSKVASRLQSSRSREASAATIFNPVSGKSSRPESSIVEDDSISASGWSSVRATPPTAVGATGSTTMLSPPLEDQDQSRRTSGGSGVGRTAGNLESNNSRRRDRRRYNNGRSPKGSDIEADVYSVEGSLNSYDDNDSYENGGRSGSRSNDDDDDRESDDSNDAESGDGSGEHEDEALGAHVGVYSVSREPKSGYNAIESQHVGDIIRTLSYWIWRAQK